MSLVLVLLLGLTACGEGAPSTGSGGTEGGGPEGTGEASESDGEGDTSDDTFFRASVQLFHFIPDASAPFDVYVDNVEGKEQVATSIAFLDQTTISVRSGAVTGGTIEFYEEGTDPASTEPLIAYSISSGEGFLGGEAWLYRDAGGTSSIGFAEALLAQADTSASAGVDDLRNTEQCSGPNLFCRILNPVLVNMAVLGGDSALSSSFVESIANDLHTDIARPNGALAPAVVSRSEAVFSTQGWPQMTLELSQGGETYTFELPDEWGFERGSTDRDLRLAEGQPLIIVGTAGNLRILRTDIESGEGPSSVRAQ